MNTKSDKYARYPSTHEEKTTKLIQFDTVILEKHRSVCAAKLLVVARQLQLKDSFLLNISLVTDLEFWGCWCFIGGEFVQFVDLVKAIEQIWSSAKANVSVVVSVRVIVEIIHYVF